MFLASRGLPMNMTDHLARGDAAGARSQDESIYTHGSLATLARLTGYNANQLDRLFLPAALLILAVMATVQIGSIRQEAQTFDEGTHLAAGLSYWKTGDYRMNPEHPPLGKLLCALPLLFTDVRLPFEYPSWDQKDELNFGAEFLYTNKLSADQILFPARCVTIVLTLL